MAVAGTDIVALKAHLMNLILLEDFAGLSSKVFDLMKTAHFPWPCKAAIFLIRELIVPFRSPRPPLRKINFIGIVSQAYY